MIFFQKKVGETPLQMLDRLRVEQPEFLNSKLSYAGRLDPMAEGEMIVLVDEENKEYKKYLGYDKKYQATFLLGIKTDTGDILGFITEFNKNIVGEKSKKDFLEGIEKQILNFVEIKKQKYPWFSSMVVDGLKLFDHFKKGNLNIGRPSREVTIKKVEKIKFDKISKIDLEEYVLNNISKIKGDFRQKETLEKWESFLKTSPDDFITVDFEITVSTGTYIRALTENIGYPVLLLKLHRKKIIV